MLAQVWQPKFASSPPPSGNVSRDVAAIHIWTRIVRCKRPVKHQKPKPCETNQSRFLGRGCDEALFSEKCVFQGKGGRQFSESGVWWAFLQERQFSEEVRAIRSIAGLWKLKSSCPHPLPENQLLTKALLFFPLLPVGSQDLVLMVVRNRFWKCPNEDNFTLRFVGHRNATNRSPRCTQETDGIAAKLVRCGIASEASSPPSPPRARDYKIQSREAILKKSSFQ